MGQFILGLFAGIVVGLVMEWVIDWTGLLPKGAMVKRMPKKQLQGAQTLPVEQNEVQQITERVSPQSSPNQSMSGG